MSRINLIVAASDNLVIGNGNTLPWNIPTDLKFFKRMTEGYTVIMGRKCWDSIPEKYRPLPNRHNIIITRNTDFNVDGAEVKNDLIETINSFKNDGLDDEVFIIGGGQIYKESFNLVDRVLLTRIIGEVIGDIFLEGLNLLEWKQTHTSPVLEENGYKFQFVTYE
jgi:dihydrofolate reductase